jgi:hypothetical protein
MFGLKKGEATGDERELHSVELRSSYSSPDIIRMAKSGRMTFLGHVVRMGKESSAYKKTEEKIPQGRHRHRWKYNIKTDLKYMEEPG